jgi:hypothetical protein
MTWLADAATPEHAAAPFALGAAVALLGIFISWVVKLRVRAAAPKAHGNIGTSGIGQVGVSELEMWAVWATDAGQVLTALFVALAALIGLAGDIGELAQAAYIAAAGIALIFFMVVLGIRPDNYDRCTKLGISLVTAVTFAINVGLGIFAYEVTKDRTERPAHARCGQPSDAATPSSRSRLSCRPPSMPVAMIASRTSRLGSSMSMVSVVRPGSGSANVTVTSASASGAPS